MRLIWGRPILARCVSKIWLVAVGLFCFTQTAIAAGVKLAPDTLSAEVRYTTAIETQGGSQSLSRVAIKPGATWRFSKAWQAETSLRLELADDETGLGGVDNYSALSQPWVDSENARIELDRAHLTWRSGASRVRVGKQVTAWGVVDGLRITDRFDAVRRRDFLYTELRPERIARWGLQARTDIGAWTIELSSALDPTVSQQANLGDAFASQATRFTGGLNMSTLTASLPKTSIQIRTAGRDAYGRDLTYGARTSRDLGSGRLSLLGFRGPTTDPVLEWADGIPGTEIELRYPLRTLVGASLDYTLGSTVFRAEFAYIPDQPVNLESNAGLASTVEERWLAGVALDLNAPFGVFINAQLAVDYMQEDEVTFVRPQTDLIATVRAQRSFPQSGWKIQVEYLGSLTDGDGVARPQISKELNDKLSFSVGGDLAFGNGQGIFGQFEDRNRGWLRVQLNL